jgi:hypothetical protein
MVSILVQHPGGLLEDQVTRINNWSQKNINQKDFEELLVVLEKIRDNYELYDEILN